MAKVKQIARGAMKRDPKVSTQPVRGEGEQAVGDRATRRAAERAAQRAPVERLSPGVYRSASGGLVTQSGRPIQRQPQAPMAQQIAGGMLQGMTGQIAGGQLGQPQGQGPDAMTAANQAAGMGQQFGNMPQYNDLMYRMSPEEAGNRFARTGMQNPWAPQMPQASANQGGRYRLSPGVYGTREQAMQQYNQQLAQMQSSMQGAYEATGQGSPNSGPGSFPMQQRERELGYAENRFNAARNNNLFRGNPVRRFKF